MLRNMVKLPFFTGHALFRSGTLKFWGACPACTLRKNTNFRPGPFLHPLLHPLLCFHHPCVMEKTCPSFNVRHNFSLNSVTHFCISWFPSSSWNFLFRLHLFHRLCLHLRHHLRLRLHLCLRLQRLGAVPTPPSKRCPAAILRCLAAVHTVPDRRLCGALFAFCVITPRCIVNLK